MKLSHLFPRAVVVTAVMAGALLSGCARSPASPVPQLPLARVVVVPVAPIDKMHTENKGIPLGILWQSIADRIKSSDFNERMEAARKDMGPNLTATLVRQLIAQGYEAQAADGGTAGQPAGSSIDESKLPPTDAVLRISLNEVGMYSARFSKDYVPRVNLSAYLVRGQTEDSLYSETLYYGADSSGEASWSVPANPDHHWSSFNEMFDRPQEVARSYDYAVNALAKRIAQNIRVQAPPAAARSAGS